MAPKVTKYPGLSSVQDYNYYVEFYKLNMHAYKKKFKNIGQAQWHIPAIPATLED